MTIAAFSTAGFSQYIAASSNVTVSQQAFQSLQQSLTSGNLVQAQAAFNTYQQLNQSATTAANSSGSSSTSTAAPTQFSTDLTALGTAIGSGDLTTAQAAFATLQGDLKNSPSQSLTNAESAVAQTVSWVDDLLNLNGNSQQDTTPVDPTTAILDSAYGLSSSSSNTDPTTSILENADGTSGSGTSSSSSSPISSVPASASTGNLGSGASVNAYA